MLYGVGFVTDILCLDESSADVMDEIPSVDTKHFLLKCLVSR